MKHNLLIHFEKKDDLELALNALDNALGEMDSIEPLLKRRLGWTRGTDEQRYLAYADRAMSEIKTHLRALEMSSDQLADARIMFDRIKCVADRYTEYMGERP